MARATQKTGPKSAGKTANTGKQPKRGRPQNAARQSDTGNGNSGQSDAKSDNTMFGAGSAYTNPFAFGNANPTDFMNSFNPSNFMQGQFNSSQFNPSQFMQGFNTGDTEQWMATIQKNLETSIVAGQRVMGSFKEVAEKQAAFFSSLMQDNTSAMQGILTSNADSKKKLQGTSDALKDSMERLATNTRETMQHMERTATDVSQLLNKRMSDCLDEIKDAA